MRIIELMMLNIVLLEDITKGHNSVKNYPTIKHIKYSHKLEVLISPVTFHSNCIGGIREAVRCNIKIIKET